MAPVNSDGCVSERMSVHLAAIEAGANDFSVMHRHRTYGDFSECRGFPRERERLLHESFVVTHGDQRGRKWRSLEDSNLRPSDS